MGGSCSRNGYQDLQARGPWHKNKLERGARLEETGRRYVRRGTNPDGTREFGLISFETISGDSQLGYYHLDPTVPFTTAGNPDWLISRQVEDADFFVENGIFRVRLTGPAGETITYSGTPRL